jgi:hypothetical protein
MHNEAVEKPKNKGSKQPRSYFFKVHHPARFFHSLQVIHLICWFTGPVPLVYGAYYSLLASFCSLGG